MEAWEALLESILGLVGAWEAKRQQGKGSGRAWVGPGAAGDPQMDPTCAQLEPNWSQLGANMGPLEPNWSQLGRKWDPDLLK